MPNLLSPRDLISRHDNMDETVIHTNSPILHVLDELKHSLLLFKKSIGT